MLLSGTIGVIAAFLAVTAWRLMRRGDVRFRAMQLRSGGRLTVHGYVFIGSIVVTGLALVHSMAVRGLLWAADRVDSRVTVSFDQALAGEGISAGARTDAERGVRLFTLARGLRHGGIGLADTPEGLVRLSWMQLVAGDAGACIRTLREVGVAGGDGVGTSLARVLLARGRGEEAEAELRAFAARGALAPQSRGMLCMMLAQSGRQGEAEEMCRGALKKNPEDVPAAATLARLRLGAGDPVGAGSLLEGATGKRPHDASLRVDYAIALARQARFDEALEQLRGAAHCAPGAVGQLQELGAQILESAGRGAEVAGWCERLGKND
jgi:hypothetical protein